VLERVKRPGVMLMGAGHYQPSARATILITTRLKCSIHRAQPARVKGLIKRPPAACICPLLCALPAVLPSSWRCNRHEHPDTPSQVMSCGR
jgi:hypothetical protein